MKKAFTLVELLIVVVVLVTLISITFRLAGSGGDSTARNRTINRLQRVENCLSGYYAAYGSYPPVKLHGSRDYMLEVDAHGIQQLPQGSGSSTLKGLNAQQGAQATEMTWKSVEAACRSQPLGMSYPFTKASIQDYIKKVSNMLMERAQSDDPKYAAYKANAAVLSRGITAITDNSMVSSKESYEDWTDVQLFKFGLLSYLVPRYLVMLGGENNMNQLYNNQRSWTVNNRLPCRFEDGVPYTSWSEVNSDVREEPWKVAVLPSQATCARWMPNLEGTLRTQFQHDFYGVLVKDDSDAGGGLITADNPNPVLYSTQSHGGAGSSGGDQYALDGMTVVDGWGHELYYYSPPPHQSYTLWSSGKNGMTFPPWVSDEELRSLKTEDQKKAQEWKSDDIMKMSN